MSFFDEYALHREVLIDFALELPPESVIREAIRFFLNDVGINERLSAERDILERLI